MCNYLIHAGRTNQRPCDKPGDPFCILHSQNPGDTTSKNKQIILDLQKEIAGQKYIIQERDSLIAEQKHTIKKYVDNGLSESDLIVMQKRLVSNTEVYLYTRADGDEMAIMQGRDFFILEANGREYDRLFDNIRMAETSTNPIELVYKDRGATVILMNETVYKRETGDYVKLNELIDSLQDCIKTDKNKIDELKSSMTKLTALYDNLLRKKRGE